MNLIDLTGQIYGELHVDSRAPSHKKPSGQTATMWNCTCRCGNTAVVSTSELRSGGTLSCGCLRDGRFTRKYKAVVAGDTFGHLTAVEKVTGEKRETWLFKCVCGQEVKRRIDMVRNSANASCGCMRSEILKTAYKEERRKTTVKDLPNQVFGRLLVIERVYPPDKDLRHAWWKCQCLCGKIVNVESGKLLRGITQSCGCYAHEKSSQLRLIDLTGRKFGAWTVIERGEDYICQKNGVHCPRWVCRCDCGVVKLVFGSVLRKGTSNSCGCMRESKGEKAIREILDNNNIAYETQFSFDDLRSIKNALLLFDFCIFKGRDICCLIEFQGEQHYETDPAKSFGYVQRTYTDKSKKEYCKNHQYQLYEIRYDEDIQEAVYKILTEECLIDDDPVPSTVN